MTTITIPQGITKTKEDLIAVPRKIFEDFLSWQKITKKATLKVERCKSFKVPKKHEKFYAELDKELSVALKECEEGKTIGPFNSAEEMMNSLEA
ncbi:hypothetical protein KAU19_04285 [Candidatus Parcubacteria bacterium]|nr:hypothetical protein [Candidatus Parcubacteria bacterium]